MSARKSKTFRAPEELTKRWFDAVEAVNAAVKPFVKDGESVRWFSVYDIAGSSDFMDKCMMSIRKSGAEGPLSACMATDQSGLVAIVDWYS